MVPVRMLLLLGLFKENKRRSFYPNFAIKQLDVH